MDKLLSGQSIIIMLDADEYLFKNLQNIAQSDYSIVEINSTEPEILTKALQAFPTLTIGAGTVVTTQQLDDCYQTGVHFITSPGFLPAIFQAASIYNMNYIPGAATMSDAMMAMNLGCRYIRPFPANLDFCKQLNQYLPTMHLFPAGINHDNIPDFLAIPSVAAVSVFESMDCFTLA